MKVTDFSDMKDKTCVITGGAGVIGTSITESLAAQGMNTVILDINEELAKEKINGHQNGTAVKFDL